MSGRSRQKFGRQPLAPRPTIGRHLRAVLRAAKARDAGNFTALCLAAPMDPVLRRLQRRMARHHRTRNSA